MSASEQTRLIGEPSGASVEIETTGDVFRRFLALPAALVDECRFKADTDGVPIKTTDPANVAMVDVRAEADAFASFETTSEVTAGMDLDCLTSRAANARMGRTDDEIQAAIDASTTELEVGRTYGETAVRQRDAWLNIDVDMVREEPNVPAREEMDREYARAGPVDPQAFNAAVEGVGRASDFALVRPESDGLVFTAEKTDDDGDATDATRVNVETYVDSVERDEAVSSLLSIDYLTDFASALKTARVDDLTLWVSDDYPLFVQFERTDDGQRLYGGQFMLAPRLKNGGTIGGDEQ
ncbi:hypothetical protein [Saliphagus sp. LR7]|uniref:hypothetical protein n=1 Tax=Saliphagus sp. LR7 TaxID=2282654 RepID=UPI000DF790AB|nr:hypothetical protein [Saliphagus sp. LR7]